MLIWKKKYKNLPENEPWTSHGEKSVNQPKKQNTWRETLKFLITFKLKLIFNNEIIWRVHKIFKTQQGIDNKSNR